MRRHLINQDNTFLDDKIALRIKHLPRKKIINVLDCFSGKGIIWNKIKKTTKQKINILKIDNKGNLKGIYLKGDNVKYMQGLDLDKFDIIDLDSYGVPYRQLNIIFKRHLKNCTIFITFIRSEFGMLPIGLLNELGYTKKMIKQCRTIFGRNALDKMKNYLSLHGIRKIYLRSYKNKHYIAFKV